MLRRNDDDGVDTFDGNTFEIPMYYRYIWYILITIIDERYVGDYEFLRVLNEGLEWHY